VSAQAVHIRGVGAVTPLGRDWPSSFAALAAGRGAIGTVRRFDATGYPCTVAATVDFELPDASPDRRLALLRPAMAEAVRDAQIDLRSVDKARIGVFIGAESGRAPLPIVKKLCAAAQGEVAGVFDHLRFGEAAARVARTQPAFSLLMSPAAVAEAIAAEYGAGGPVQTFSLACASSAAALIEAVRAIRLDRCDLALCGGVGADVDPLMLAGFGKLGALSSRGESCPFDLRRDGFVVGEGAAAVVLSREARAPAPGRGVAIAGTGRTLDAYHLTAPDPQGHGAERAMRAALTEADLARCDCIQAHGTSTPLNDAVEALVLRRLFGPSLDDASLSSVKGALGHWVAGAGALGLLCAYEAVRSGTVLPTCGLVEPDPRCDLPHVRHTAQQRSVDSALVNAFAFGGANCTLVVRRCA
jgi:3-oxoacyl-[acyl-carrier-protein] synthase II